MNFIISHFKYIKDKQIYSIGDMDSINTESKQFANEHKNIILIHDTDQNTTDSQKALNFLYKHYKDNNQNQPVTILSSAFGGRLDHQLYNIGLIYKERRQRNHTVIGIDQYNCQIIIENNKYYHINVPDDQDQLVGILPVDQDIICSTNGLDWDLDNTKLSFNGILSSCNSCKDKKKGFYIISDGYTQIMISGSF